MNFGLLDKDIKIILEAIKTFPEINEALIFGSRAMGNFKKGSDVDIVIKGNDLKSNTATKLSTILNQEKPSPYYYDILNYNEIDNKQLLKHIDQYGLVIFKLY